ncbi:MULTISPECIES: ProQ/FINO family protein [Vibrionaceae]|uniref:ProQ/FinO domain-containing protein n=2 Tax=Vibrio TaxID=662 RepID=A0A7U6J5V2_VIBAN|nr:MULTISPECIES: ProQ/FINO family protein [Vibrionaceae]AZS27514.1 hypothetical protein DYL72_21625 [Vibrio anguillarum]AZS27535.1 hypothetical protein DYL72_21740 [Vibrio anguillarum]AZS27550.1 hypothetical protein DYL72_21825 [Vibrio anguillarum]OEE73427.1 hypothetical protein A147_01010 [Vibrio splendidus FF-6]PSB86202.1 hypothetical protein C5F62_02960 [Photobacterium damselae subsp. damselae]
MATIIIKKKRKLVTPEPSTTSTPAKKLSLKPKPKESPKKKIETKKNETSKAELTPEQRTYINNAKAINAKIKSIKRAKRWLMDTWPKVFDYDDFKPLAIGINKIVAEQYRQDRDNGKDLGFGWKHLATSLDRWVKKKAYIEALKTGTHRYNLDGTQSEEILEEHRVSDRQKDKKS